MDDKIIELKARNRFRGYTGTLPPQSDIMNEREIESKEIIKEITQSLLQTAATNESEGVSNLNITTKEYLDNRIDTLEKSIDSKFDAQEKLLSEKIEHLHTKIEMSIGQKLTDFKTETEKERKEDRKFYITIAVSLSAVVVALLGFVF